MYDKNFKHKGLKKLFTEDNCSGIDPKYQRKIYKILSLLDIAESLDEINDFPGYRLHPLKGELEGYWSVTVIGNYRIIFKFENKQIFDVDFIDYH